VCSSDLKKSLWIAFGAIVLSSSNAFAVMYCKCKINDDATNYYLNHCIPKDKDAKEKTEQTSAYSCDAVARTITVRHDDSAGRLTTLIGLRTGGRQCPPVRDPQKYVTCTP